MTFRPATLVLAAVALGAGLTVATTPTPAAAQDQGDRPERPDREERRQQRGERGERGGRFDPEQMRERMSQMLKERMNATDEEWEVISPRLEAVMEAQREARVGGMMGFGRRGGLGGRGGPQGADEDASELAKASRALGETLQDENASAEQIGERLETFRAAREEAEKQLQTARGELVELLTPRQEATLVMMGVLE